jgi:hypothetical protein
MWSWKSAEASLCAPFIVSMSPPDYPSASLRPAEPASVSPGKIIVAPPPPVVPTSGLPVIRPVSVNRGLNAIPKHFPSRQE